VKKNTNRRRAVSFLFDLIEPGATATVTKTEELSLRPLNVVINPRDYDRGADFAGFETEGLPYAVPPMVGNPIQLDGNVVPPGTPISLTLKNNGVHSVYPSAVVIMEVAEG
jgi:hypothetical protein